MHIIFFTFVSYGYVHFSYSDLHFLHSHPQLHTIKTINVDSLLTVLKKNLLFLCFSFTIDFHFIFYFHFFRFSLYCRRKDSSALQRSASIDSFAEIVWSDSPRPSLDIPRNAVAPFSKRPSASSLYSNCSASSQSAQLNINELYNYGGIGIGVGSGGSAGALSGGVTVGTTSATTGNSRRESLLSPSSTRRNKLSRIINGKYGKWKIVKTQQKKKKKKKRKKTEKDKENVSIFIY